MTLGEFLEWEERQERKFEFNGFQPVAMVGGTAAHAGIARNLIVALSVRLRGKPCQPYGGDLKVEVAGRIRYPDAFVVCTPLEPAARVVTGPVVVFEILSPSSTYTDLVLKNGEYEATPSLQRYVVLQQVQAGATIFARKGEDWVSHTLAGDEGVLRMPEIGIEIPLAELYAEVELTGEARSDD